MQERLQKILAQAGVASRRKAEELIRDGRVTVDGTVVTELGQKANPKSQRIAVDGKLVVLERTVNLILHKPTSYVTTVKDPEGRRTVLDLVADVDERVYPVGRLDYDTSGLLLLSNDGDLTQRLLHPSFHAEKVYRATVLGMPEKDAIAKLRTGIELEDGTTAPADVAILRHHPAESVLEITIHEGRNRQVRRMLEAIEHPVKRLKRIQFGPLELGNLPPGAWRWLTREEWKQLYEAAELPAPEYVGGQRTVVTERGKPSKVVRGRTDSGAARKTRTGSSNGRRSFSETGRKTGSSRPVRGRNANGEVRNRPESQSSEGRTFSEDGRRTSLGRPTRGRTAGGQGRNNRSSAAGERRSFGRQSGQANGTREFGMNKGAARGSAARRSKKR